MFAKGPISWKSQTQGPVTLSSCEAELMALVKTIQETLYLRRLFRQLHIPQLSTTIYEDNKAAIDVIEDPKTSQRRKHMDIRDKFVEQAVQDGFIKVTKIKSENNLADILTKRLPRQQHEYLSKRILQIPSH